jgi:hypothetical protein
MPLLLAFLLIPLVVIVLIPVSLLLRIRHGTMRRQARGWVIAANTVAIAFSTLVFMTWAPYSGSSDSRSHGGNPAAARCTTHLIAGSWSP